MADSNVRLEWPPVEQSTTHLVRSSVRLYGQTLVLVTGGLSVILLAGLSCLGLLLYEFGLDPSPLYGRSYYFCCTAYTLLLCFKTFSSLAPLSTMQPTRISHLAFSLLLICYVEFLIFSRGLFSIIQMDAVSDHFWKMVSTSILSLVKFICSLGSYYCLKSAISVVVWDVGDAI